MFFYLYHDSGKNKTVNRPGRVVRARMTPVFRSFFLQIFIVCLNNKNKGFKNSGRTGHFRAGWQKTEAKRERRKRHVGNLVKKVLIIGAGQLNDPRAIRNVMFLKKYVSRGKLGRKSGEGFYRSPGPGFSTCGFYVPRIDGLFCRIGDVRPPVPNRFNR